jgi:PucR C-terminal helix-turn-helix domain/GGDEF-like domain
MAVTPRDVQGVRAVAGRLAARREEIAQRAIDRFRERLVGWQDVDEAVLDAARAFALRNVEAFVGGLERDAPIGDDLLAAAREAGAQRVHQGVSFEALVHGNRLWAETLWESVLAASGPDRPEEREAALEIAGRVWRHLDSVSTAMSHGYLDEVTDRGLLGRDLLDALLAGRGDCEPVRRTARLLHRRLGESYIVVVVRPGALPGDDGTAQGYAGGVALDQIVAATRSSLRPAQASLLVAIRLGDVVALFPAGEPTELDTVRRGCEALARELGFAVSVGMSGWHRGRSAIATAYSEAREAAQMAAGAGITGRAVTLDDVLVDHMLGASPHARRILRETLAPVVGYDRTHRSELVATLRAYLEAGAALTRSAGLLHVHPNTVVYRLRRIGELTGRDPSSMPDLQILFLALRLHELSAGPA